MNIKHYESEDWKHALESWRCSDDAQPRRMVLVAAAAHKDQRRVTVIQANQDAISFEISTKRLDEAMREIGPRSALTLDMVALGVGPLPPPVPPGPVGKDTIYAAFLQLYASAFVLSELVRVNAEHQAPQR